jgi:hypothetical protein
MMEDTGYLCTNSLGGACNKNNFSFHAPGLLCLYLQISI